MIIQTVDISHLRNINSAQLQLLPTINVVCGENGSGKTSLLEAIFLLTHGRSFRSRKIDRIISHEQQQLLVRGRLIEAEKHLDIAIQRTIDGKSRLKIANEEVKSFAELVKHYPVLLINPDSYRILENGPKYRRQFLDWGLFHVEHSFYSLWQRYHRVLKQRNHSLKQRVGTLAIKAWDQELISTAEAIDGLRQRYLQAYEAEFEPILKRFLPAHGLSLQYRRGWSQKHSLEDLLQQSLPKDREQGYSTYGPHRADLQIRVGQHQAHEVLSRGQQKLLIFALRIAQGRLLQQSTGKACGYLIDDMPAELDKRHQQVVMDLIHQQQAQIVLTGVDDTIFTSLLKEIPYKMFHMEHGMLKECYNSATIKGLSPSCFEMRDL